MCIRDRYFTTVAIDKDMHKNKQPVYEKIPELKNIGHYLVAEG